jgi:hypothetical protein
MILLLLALLLIPLIQSAELKNANIITSKNHETNQKAINEIVLNSIMRNKWAFTASEWSTINSIANMCPYPYGPAVFDARSLVNAEDPTITFDDVNICNNNQQLRKAVNSEAQHGEINCIFPNPASNSISLNRNINFNTYHKFTVNNAWGTNIITIDIKSGLDLNNVDIHSLPNGIYNCELIGDEVNKQLGKLIVVH